MFGAGISVGTSGIGPQGSTGAQGDSSAAGAQGSQGSQGSQGILGTAGTAGATGVAGSVGNQGFQGNQGAQGSQGAQGAQGAGGGGNIAFDAASSGGSNGTVASKTISHVLGSGSNRYLIVGVSLEQGANGQTISGVTFNGVAMTAGPTVNEDSETSKLTVGMFYMLEANLPAAGTYDIVASVSNSGEIIVGGVSLTGVHQAAPEASATSNTAVDGTSFSTNIATVTNNAWVVEMIASGSSCTWTPDSGQTERLDLTSSGTTSMAMATKEVASAGSTSFAWTSSASSNRTCHALVSLKVA